MRRTLGVFVIAGLAAVGLACGSNTPVRLPDTGATLEGTITYGPEEVRFANITVTDGTTTAYGTVGEDGRYKVENVPIGEVTIGVNTDEGKGQHTELMMSGGGAYQGPEKAAGGRGKGAGGVPKFVPVPAKYHFPPDSGIKTTTKAGSNTFDVVIPKGK